MRTPRARWLADARRPKVWGLNGDRHPPPTRLSDGLDLRRPSRPLSLWFRPCGQPSPALGIPYRWHRRAHRGRRPHRGRRGPKRCRPSTCHRLFRGQGARPCRAAGPCQRRLPWRRRRSPQRRHPLGRRCRCCRPHQWSPSRGLGILMVCRLFFSPRPSRSNPPRLFGPRPRPRQRPCRRRAAPIWPEVANPARPPHRLARRT
mmetsp:Transcript_121534/g.343840  ORF Transcript_121534/g.343840 Transcript_121534/m.343840 type:complete len:203 (-) Transcript_121534:1880-2488(-)